MRSLRSTWHDLKAQMVKDPLPPNRVAAGWALGMFVGCFIPFGLQLIVSVPLSFLLRVSKIGATVGTLVTNPVSIIFIYPAQIWVGSRLIGAPLTWSYIQDITIKLTKISLLTREGWMQLSEIGGLVLGSLLAGGLLLALVCTPIAFFAVKHIVVSYRSLRIRRQGGSK